MTEGRRTSAIDAFPELRLVTEDSLRQRRRSTLLGLSISTHDADGHRQSLLTDSIRLKTSEVSTNRAAYAMMFAVAADGVVLMCQSASLAIMTTPGAHPDSFPSIEPFDITTAQYVIWGSISIGLVMSNFFFGWLATRIGSRKCALILMGGSVVFTFLKYFARSYWTFTMLGFINALFGSSAAVGGGYVALLFRGNRLKIDAYIGYILATALFSRSLGSLFAIMFPAGLFEPLIPAVIVSAVAFVVVYQYVLDPDTDPDTSSCDNIDQDTKDESPKTLDKPTFANIVVCSFLDNIGSCGLVPLGFSPVLYRKFYLDFDVQGLDPIMSYSQFIWLYSLIGMTVVPTALITPWCYEKIGIACTSLLGNILTGLAILGLVFAAMLPPTKTTYVLCTSIIYIGWPLAVLSNFSTSPMLDRITPVKTKTLIQGINVAIYDMATGICPILFGYVSDTRGYIPMLLMCVGVQGAATLASLPLVFNPLLKPKPANEQSEEKTEIDEAEIEKLLELGEYVSIQDQYNVNKARADKGEPYLKTRFGKYSTEHTEIFGKLNTRDLEFARNATEQRLAVLHGNTELKERYLETVNATCPDVDAMTDMKQEMGEWMTDYLQSNGYLLGLENPQIFKGLFIYFFPPIIEESKLTTENVEGALIQNVKRLNNYMEKLRSDERKAFWKKLHSGLAYRSITAEPTNLKLDDVKPQNEEA